MAIGFERQQKSLIGGNLPQARIDINPPDLSGLQRLGNAMMNAGVQEAREKKDLQDQMEGLKRGDLDGSSWVGKDENGNPVEFTIPEGSAAFQRAYVQGFDQRQDGQFRLALESRYNEIQARFIAGEITAEEASALMTAHLEGQVKNTPEHRRGYYTELGNVEVMQRSGLMQNQQATQRAQIVVEDLTAGIKRDVEKASALASAGADPTSLMAQVDKSYDSLVAMRRMGEQEASIAKSNVRQLVTGQALVNRLTTAMAKGEISPSEVDRFGTAIETNDASTSAVVRKAYQVGPGARSTVDQAYGTGEVFAKITNEDMRKDMGLKLRQAATDWNSRAKALAEQNALRDQLLFQDGPAGMYTALPSALQDDADLLVSNILASGRPFDTPEGEQALLSTLGAARYAPKPLIKQLVAMVNSQDDAQVQKAVQMWQKISTLTTKHGVNAGDLIWRDVTEEDRNFLDAIRDAYSLQYPVRDIVDNMRTARGSRNFAMDQLISDYNSAVSGQDRGFEKDFLAKWQEDFGGAADPQASDSFAKAYRQSMIILRDPEKAFNDAYDRMKRVYQKSDIFVAGVARTGRAELTNPYGYEGPTDLFGNPASGSEYNWLQDYIAADISLAMGAGNLVLPEGMSPDQMNQVFRRPETRTVTSGRGATVTMDANGGGASFLGKNVKLQPVPGSNPDAPEYALRLFDDQGNDLGYLYRTAPSGRQTVFTINPHVQRSQEQATAVYFEKRKALESAAQYSRDELMLETIRKGGIEVEGDPRAYQKMPFEEYLGGIDPELEKQYRLDKMQIEDGLKKAIEQLEQEQGTPVSPSKMSPQSLMLPKAAGFDVAAAAASTIDAVLPDGTSGTFLMRIAAQESAFGTASGTYRMIGDKGMMQTNTHSSVKEVKRQIALGSGRVFEANQKLKASLGIDLAAVTTEDLDKPLVSMAMARAYMEAIGTPVPQDVAGQAAWWKRHYNTYAGAGTMDQFIANADKVPDQWRMAYAQQEERSIAEGSGVTLRYANAAAKRNLPVTPSLEAKLVSAVGAVFGPGYEVEVFSGGQRKGKSRGYTGTGRHTDKTGKGGRAADIYVVGPNGKRVTDAGRLMLLRNYWLANGYGSVGHFMDGWGMHLDEITADQLGPGQSLTWRY